MTATFSPSFKASLSLWKSRFPLAAGSCGGPKCLLTFHICQPVHYSGEFDTSEMSLWQESLSWNENWSKRKKTKERWKCNLYSQICNCSLVLKAGYMSALQELGDACSWSLGAHTGLIRGTEGLVHFTTQWGFQTLSRCHSGLASRPWVYPQHKELTHLGRNYPINSKMLETLLFGCTNTRWLTHWLINNPILFNPWVFTFNTFCLSPFPFLLHRKISQSSFLFFEAKKDDRLGRGS